MSKTGKSMEAVKFVTKLFWQYVHQIDSGGVFWLSALSFFTSHDIVLSSRITVLCPQD